MMMKQTLYILLLLYLLTLGACTHNDGNIGNWFGTWHVQEITCHGEQVVVNCDYFFQFQSTVFRISQVGDHEQTVESFGIWDDSTEGKMIISFPDPAVYYLEMPGLESSNTFTITSSSSHEVTFSKVDHAGASYTYHLKKQP